MIGVIPARTHSALLDVYMYVCMYVCMYACMHVCVYMYVCVYICYVCIYVYMYVYIHIYIYMYVCRSMLWRFNNVSQDGVGYTLKVIQPSSLSVPVTAPFCCTTARSTQQSIRRNIPSLQQYCCENLKSQIPFPSQRQISQCCTEQQSLIISTAVPMHPHHPSYSTHTRSRTPIEPQPPSTIHKTHAKV